MRASLLIDTMKAHHAAGVPLLIEGEPGVGKSTIPEQAAKDLGIGLIKFNVPTRALEDYGVPVISDDKDTLSFAVPRGIFPFVGDDTFPDKGLIVVDELSSANNPEQKLWASIIYDRWLHGHQFKPGWTFVATGNRTKDRAGANRLLGQLSDRLTRYTMDPSLDDWCSWALDNGVSTMVVAFLRFKPNLLSAYNPDVDVSPTPRAWAQRVSPFVDLGMPSEFDTYAGSVGEGAAAEFMGFLKMYRALPSIDAILMQPDTFEVFEEPALLYAISGSLGSRATPANFDRVVAYAKRLPPEFMVLTVLDSLRADKTLTNTRTYIDWISNHGKNVMM